MVCLIFRCLSTRAAAIRLVPSRYVSLLLPIAQRGRTHRTKAIELVNFDVIRPRRLVCHRWLRVHQLLTWLRLLACRLASLLCRKRLLVGIELLLFSDVDFVLRRSGKNVIQFSLILHGRDPVLGKPIDRLLLLGGRDRYDLKTRLREQELLLGCGEFGLVGSGGLARCN